jgi:hypothetical protein
MVTTVSLVAQVMLITRPTLLPSTVLSPGVCKVKLMFQPP